MYIKVKTMDGKESVMLTVSKMSLIEEVRKLVEEKLAVETSCQRLFFRGKQVGLLFCDLFELYLDFWSLTLQLFMLQMEDGYRLIDYGININDVVQLMVRATPLPAQIEESPQNEGIDDDAKNKKTKKVEDESLVDTTCEYYEV